MVMEKPTILITGSDDYLGLKFIERYQSLYRFVCLSRRHAGHITDDLSVINCDLADDETPDMLFEEFKKVQPVDFVINGAADIRFYAERSEILCSTHEVIRQYKLNTLAPALVVAALFEAQLKDRPLSRNHVSILNISSESAFSPITESRQSFYAASKAALNCLTMHLSAEYRDFNILINALAPGNFVDEARCIKVVEAIHEILHLKETGKIYRMPF